MDKLDPRTTARAVWEQSYALVLVEDAMSSHSAEAHRFAIEAIMPRLGRVRATADVLAMLG